MRKTTNLESMINELMQSENCTREYAIMIIEAMVKGVNETGTAHLIFK